MKKLNAALLLTVSIVASRVSGEDLVGRGQWHSTNAGGVRGSWTAELARTETGVRGTLKIDGSNVFVGGVVEGTMSDGQVILGVFQEGQKVASFAGRLREGTVSGEWDAPAVADTGVWEGKLTVESK